MKILIVGAGLSGATLAASLSPDNDVTVIEEKPYIGGMCKDEIEEGEDYCFHKHCHGPHIFHTDNERVIQFISMYEDWIPYNHRVKTTAKGCVYSMPINLHTINQLFHTTYSPMAAKFHIEQVREYFNPDNNLEGFILKNLGTEIYKTFFEGYTKKQWNVHPSNLPEDIIKRLPIRYTYDDNYFKHDFVALPKHGYTKFIENLLKGSKVILNCKFDKEIIEKYDYVFYTGCIDEFYDNIYGKLSYRTCHFEESEIMDIDDGLGCPVMNFADIEVPYTRKADYYYLTPKSVVKGSKTRVVTEYSSDCGEDDLPFYPIFDTKNKEIMEKYRELALNEKKVAFVGRLANYQYMDMDSVIDAALNAVSKFRQNCKNG